MIAVGPMLGEGPPDANGRSTAPLDVPRLVACLDGSPESEAVLPVAVGRAQALQIAKWSGSGPDVTGSVHWDPISAAAGIRDYLRQQTAGMLAVTTHAGVGIHRVVHGAEAANIVRQSVVPVLMLPQLTDP